MPSLTEFLIVAALLFGLGIAGIILNRNNIIVLLMSIELILLSVNTNFIAFSYFLSNYTGQIFVFFVLTVAASEAAIGLAILMVLYRKRATIEIQQLDALKG
jgi:NADH-quinone oxidoreductase subunit K